ncbi:thioredoxin peroxidase [Candidatus Uhrbacteria bacterium RIFOXYC12_FULL_57_11]|nr:MAG: thioredoxin peroxidase [Candidatus Uhrbacteria bacterium RIFOXYC12_FULL_57_11]
MIRISQPAPIFENATAYKKGQDDFAEVSLSDYGGKWLVFFFYPRDFTFICPTELRGFTKHRDEFSALNCEVLAASTDSEWSHKNWFERDLPEVDYPILADNTHAIATAYDVYNPDDGLAERGTFIIDPDGVVRYALISSGSVGRSVTETLRVLKALQSGELCPVEWSTGDQTLGKA